MLILAALASVIGSGIDCRTFAARADQPVEVRIDRLAIDRIAADATPIPKDNAWDSQTYRVGRLVYQGTGFTYSSDDGRFGAIEAGIIGQTGAVCRYAIGLPSGYDPARGGYVQDGRITLSRLDTPAIRPEGPQIADRVGARPSFAGYAPVASDSLYADGKQLLLALMKPASRRPVRTTIVVASALKRGSSPATLLAKLEGDYRSISVVPNIHGSDWGIGLVGLDANGSLKTASFRIGGDVVAELMARLGTPMR